MNLWKLIIPKSIKLNKNSEFRDKNTDPYIGEAIDDMYQGAKLFQRSDSVKKVRIFFDHTLKKTKLRTESGSVFPYVSRNYSHHRTRGSFEIFVCDGNSIIS